MKPRTSCSLPAFLTTTLSLIALLGLPSAHAAVLALDFAGGNGNAQVDQYTGVAGSGWTTAWSQANGTDVTGLTGTVINTSPIAGGDNYLHVTYNTGGAALSGTNHSAGVSRQWDTTGVSISMTDPITLSFFFRSDTAIQSSIQSFTLTGSSSAGIASGPGDSWRLSLDGGGLNVYSNPTVPTNVASRAQLGTDAALAPLKFTLTLNPTADTYTVAVTNLTTSVTYTSGIQTFRSSGDASLSFINIFATGAPNLTGTGFSIDGFSVVPEPSTPLLLLGAGLGMLGMVSRRRAGAGRI